MDQNRIESEPLFVVTAGSTYLDIDAYACCVALAQLLVLKGKRAIACSAAPHNYSVCDSLTDEGQFVKTLPSDETQDGVRYMIVDVSDPHYLADSIPLDRVAAVYDHHTGFEAFWHDRIGDNAHIEFIGAAATLIFKEWETAGLLGEIPQPTALLLIAAILDNTLDLTSSNTTEADIKAYETLCSIAGVGDEWRADYFSQVQKSVEADLKNALFNDLKVNHSEEMLPPLIAQISVWNADGIIGQLPLIRRWFAERQESWMMNIIDIRRRRSCFVCDDPQYRQTIEKVFGVLFFDGVAETPSAYLRKQIIKKIQTYTEV